MHQGIDLKLPEMPTSSSVCQEDLRTEYADGSNDVAIGSAPADSFLDPDVIAYCKIGFGLMSAIGGPKFNMKYDLYSYGISPPSNDTSTLMISLELPKCCKC